MLAIKHILFPIDFSDRTCGAVPFVDGVARRFDAKVTLMSVAPPLRYADLEAQLPATAMDDEDLRNDLQTRLDGALTGDFEGIPVQRVAEVGEPGWEITKFAHANDIGLIMMPTHGYGPFRRFLLGSVTAKVLHDAHCPVWTAVHIEEKPSLDHVACRTILCAVDGTPKSASLIEWAADFARQAGATLRLVNVVPGVDTWPERQLDREFEEALRVRARNDIEKIAKSRGVEAPLCITVGRVDREVGNEARRHSADLIVIGRGLIHETFGRLRTHAYSIIREAPCPVISV